ncbi:hypothetical protein [Streptomyces bobili]|uniref:hypothetical protein n=1 Tax=Streptomyces bobili TaxID=67280 RepID=UPI0037B2A81C
MRGREGKFLLACPRQNTGRVKVVIPRIERISSAITTTPGRRTNTPGPLTIAVGVLVLVLGASLPEAWWPRIGQAFTGESAQAPADKTVSGRGNPAPAS